MVRFDVVAGQADELSGTRHRRAQPDLVDRPRGSRGGGRCYGVAAVVPPRNDLIEQFLGGVVVQIGDGA